jgi:hypothetical protein
MNNQVKKLQKKMDKHYKFIDNFVNDYCKDEKDKKEFYKHLNFIIDLNIEIEKECNL